MHLAALLGLAGLSSHCRRLPHLEENVCGNLVVELGEDCDGAAPEGLVCGAEGTGACRFLCADGTGACPAGWGCAREGICRAPSGLYQAGVSVPFNGERLQLGDINGDGQLDVVGGFGLVNRSEAGTERGFSDQISIVFGDGAGRFSDNYRAIIGNPAGPVSLGDLDRDGRTDLSVPIEDGGLEVLFGEEDKRLSTQLYGGKRFPSSALIDTLLMRLGGTEQHTRHELIGLAETASTTRIFAPGTDENAFTACPTPNGESLMTGQPHPVANLHGDGRMDSTAIGYHDAGTGSVRVALLSAACADQCACRDAATCPKIGVCDELRLPASLTSPKLRLFFSDADNDGTEDLVAYYGEDDDEGPAGAFFVTLQIGANAVQFDATTALATPETWPLAVGQIDDDGALDLVLPDALTISGQNEVLHRPLDAAWTAATLLDINGDDVVDVATANASQARILIFLGTGTPVFNSFAIETDHEPAGLRVGDFDGDLVDDLLLVENAVSGNARNLLSVSRGQYRGAPGPLEAIGTIPLIEDLHVGQLSRSDLVSDISTENRRSASETELSAIATIENQGRGFSAPVFLAEGLHPIVAEVGRYRSTAANEMLILASSNRDAARAPELWLLPICADGRLREPGTAAKDGCTLEPARVPISSSTPCLAEMVLTDNCVVAIGGDKNQDGLSELVIADRADRNDCGDNAAPRIAQITAQDGSLSVQCIDAELGSSPRQLHLRDVDFDGHADLLVSFVAPAVEGAGGSLEATGSGLHVYWSDRAGFFQSTPTVAPLPANTGLYLTGVALQSDADPLLEFIVLTTTGFHFGELLLPDGFALGDGCTGASCQIFIPDPEGGFPPREVARLNGLARSGFQFTGASADITGSGLEDLLIGHRDRLDTFVAVTEE